jgi:hypothetical protein
MKKISDYTLDNPNPLLGLDMTFLAKYARDVDYLEKTANDDIDGIMMLLLTSDPSQGLVIFPDKRGTFLTLSVASITTHSKLFVLYPQV